MLTLGKSGEKRFSDEVISYIKQGKIEEIARLLLNSDANSQIDGEGSTLLHLSVKIGTETMTKFLIESRVPIDSKNIYGETPLLNAVFHDKPGHAEILLEAGADVCVKNNDNLSVLSIILYGSAKTSESMMNVFDARIQNACTNIKKYADLLNRSGIHMNCVLNSVEPRRIDIAREMLERGYEVNLKNIHDNDDTALHGAAQNKDLKMIKILLRFGADKHIENRSGLIPFDIAFSEAFSLWNYEMMRLLIPDSSYDGARLLSSHDFSAFMDAKKDIVTLFMKRYLVDFTTRDTLFGRNVLHYLALNENEGIWEYFRNIEFDIDAQDKYGATALYLAFPKVEAIKFLLQRDAQVDILNNSFRSRFRLPILNNSHKWVVFHKPKECRECIDLLLYYGLDVQYIDDNGSSMMSLFNERARLMFVCGAARRSRREYVFEPILAHLAMLEVVNGLQIKPLIAYHINADYKFNRLYKSCKEELEKMKAMNVFHEITYFKLLTVNQDKIEQYARNEEMFEKIVQIDKNSSCYYLRYLRMRFLEAEKFNAMRNNAAKVIGEVMNVHYQNYVVEHIVRYLDKSDLKLFA